MTVDGRVLFNYCCYVGCSIVSVARLSGLQCLLLSRCSAMTGIEKGASILTAVGYVLYSDCCWVECSIVIRFVQCSP